MQRSFKETQKPLTADEISAFGGVFQVMWKGPDGRLFVHQMRGPDVRALMLNDPESKHLRDSLFWHIKASFMSVGAAVFGLDPVSIEAEPEKPSPVVAADGKPYNAGHGSGSADAN